MMIILALFFVSCLYSRIHGVYSEQEIEYDRLKQFYKRLESSDVKFCEDRSRLLPKCFDCIPGLQPSPGSNTCNEYISSSKSIRDEIRKLVVERFGENVPKERHFGLYPYLEKPDFLFRHIIFGKMLSQTTPKTIIDIGAYYNPIHIFMNHTNYCPETVIVVEPILDALSVMVPCSGTSNKWTHYIFLPVTFKYYMQVKAKLPMPETIVCIGCDSHYGPNRKMLETAFDRPYKLYIEYPSEYIHNGPFRKMMGNGPGENLDFIEKFQVKTNETVYTKRVMKVIGYK